jgi:putative inorganic carbon (HCO3(-)) transporter
MGFLTYIFTFIKSAALPILYFGGLLTTIVTIYWKAEWGLLLMVALVPQPNIYYKLYSYPMGKDFLDILFFAVVIGIFVNKNTKKFLISKNLLFIGLYLLVSYISLWNTSSNFSLPAPITTQNELLVQWKNYAMMIFMYYLAFNISKDENLHKILIMIMATVVLFISVQSIRSFTAGISFEEGNRFAGPFETVGLNSNHFAAFIVSYCSLFLGLLLFDKNKWRRLLFLAAVVLGIYPLFFSYSRGAYVAAMGVLIFFGLVKKRSLLILALILFISWQTLLPPTVVERIEMTKMESGELESSAGVRLDLWSHARDLFEKYPIFGVGWGGFRFTVPEELKYKDTHNLYLKTLSEQGIIGITLLLFILLLALRSGQKLFKTALTPFYKGLGFGFLGCIVAFIITNIFGDRWSYFVIGDYFWITWGLLDRGILIAEASTQKAELIENTVPIAGNGYQKAEGGRNA